MVEKKSRPRRQYGTGSVWQRSDGMWLGTIEAGWTERGTRRRIVVSAKNQAECKRRLREMQKKIAADGLPAASARASETVASYAERWLERRRDQVRPGGWATDASAVRKWIVPTIGRRRLSTVDTDAVHAVDRAAGAVLADSSLVRVRTTLVKMLKDARTDGHPIPARVFDVPRGSAGESDRDSLGLDDAAAVLQAASDRPDMSRWVAALLQGMRQAECLGLTWDCVDLDGGTIDVSWQLKRLPWRHGCDDEACGERPASCPDRRVQTKRGDRVRRLDGAMCLVQPKTAAGRRTIPLVPWMTAALRQWRDVAPASPHGLVWPRADGRPTAAKDDDAAWYRLQDLAQVAHTEPNPEPPVDGVGTVVGRRYTIHEARHTTGTLLMEAKVDQTVIIAIMGHTKIATTMKYQHVSQALARRALDDVAARLGLTAG